MDESAVKVAEIEMLESIALAEANKAARKIVERAREQAANAKRDRIERLKERLAEMAKRSCEYPGSVYQEELDSLPATLRQDFEESNSMPYGLDGCAVSIYTSIGLGANAEQLKSQSTPLRAQDVVVPRAHVPAYVVPAPATPAPLFSRSLSRLKDFAIRSCQAPDQIRWDSVLIPYYDHSYAAYDANLARSLAAGMDGCSRQLFYDLIEKISTGVWIQTEIPWIRSMVAVYSAAPRNTSGGFAPPSDSRRQPVVAPPSPPPAHDPEGEALRQLQEMERRKRWGLRPVL